MASLFGHAAIGYGLSRAWLKKSGWKIVLLCIICTIFPDADVIMFRFGVAYESPYGHRGFTHSIFFAVVFAVLITFLFFSGHKHNNKKRVLLFLLFFLCTLSHGILDGMTDGGLGVEYFYPFDTDRYFFPFTPIKVSPLGVARFFSRYGWSVIKSEMIWTGIPMLMLILFRLTKNKFSKKNAEA